MRFNIHDTLIKTTSIILLLALSLNASVYYLYLKLRQTKARKEIKMKIKAGVPEDELTLFYYSEANKHEFDWKHSREFNHRGVMYDIVREENPEPGVRLLYCVTDHQETLLFGNLKKLVTQQEQNLPATKKANTLLGMFLSGLFFAEKIHISNILTFNELSWPKKNEGYIQPPTKILSPPPRVKATFHVSNLI